MFEMVVSFIYNVLLTLFMGYVVVWNIARVYYWIKCFKVGTCHNRQCKFANYCDKVVDGYTKEEKEELLRAIEQRREKLKEKKNIQ